MIAALTFIQLFNTLLNVGDVIALVALGLVMLTMMARQRRDLGDNRRLVRMIIQLAVMSEEDNRKNRNAIKTIADKFHDQQLLDSLPDPVPLEEELQPGTLISKLIEVAKEADHVEAAG